MGSLDRVLAGGQDLAAELESVCRHRVALGLLDPGEAELLLRRVAGQAATDQIAGRTLADIERANAIAAEAVRQEALIPLTDNTSDLSPGELTTDVDWRVE